MIFDSHVHSIISFDSEMGFDEAIKAAHKKGLGITFTEHVDFQEGFVFDFNEYPHSYRHLRSDSVLLGVEVGLAPAFLEQNKKLGDYDFVIGSVHSVDGIDFYHDFPEDVHGFICRYLNYACEMVEDCFFDSFGHIDYIARYNPMTPDKYNPDSAGLFKFENFPNEFDRLLKIIAEKGIAIEINTSYFDKINSFPIYKRFAQLGGRYCTLGSDSHTTDTIGKFIPEAKKIADEAGLEVVYFKDRKKF